jgi:hypothetical protein
MEPRAAQDDMEVAEICRPGGSRLRAGDQPVDANSANKMPANISAMPDQLILQFTGATPVRRLAFGVIALIPSHRRQLSGRVEVDRPDSRRSGTDEVAVA